MLDDLERVCLRVEHPLVQADDLVGGEEEVEVLHRLRQPEALHGVVLHRHRLAHILDPRVPPRGDPAVLLEALEDLPAPLAEDVVARAPPHDGEALHSLRPQQVVVRPADHVAVLRKVVHLSAKSRGLHLVELVAGAHNLARHLHVLVRLLGHVRGPQRQHTRHEAREVVHLPVKPSVFALCHVGIPARGAVLHELVDHLVH
mmetsp:Transcript_29758/g.95700  ORF Transcript_29758/g.95700 Transcript_29758/m.95700 type:complete len:202 (-) Transcript_29758:941-1546(-)